MKVVLENFSCWTNKTFEFPDFGTVLISAPSGSGKTSILRAILFALFGVGQKIVQYGKKSCRVELEYLGLHIVRTKGPGRLTVSVQDAMVEGAEAQTLIDNALQSASVEMVYSDQYGKVNFVNMSAPEKLQYLQRLALADTAIKTSLRQHIIDITDRLNKQNVDLQVVERSIARLPNIQRVGEPTIRYTNEDYTATLEKDREDKRLRRILQSNENIRAKIATLERECSNTSNAKTILEELTKRQEELNQQKRNVKAFKQHLELKNSYEKQKAIYDTTVKEERARIEDEIVKLEEQIEQLAFQDSNVAKKQIETYKSTLAKHNQAVECALSLEKLTPPEPLDEIQQQYNTIKMLLDSRALVCPSCETNVYLSRDALVLAPVDTKSLRSEYKRLSQLLNKQHSHHQIYNRAIERVKETRAFRLVESDVAQIQQLLESAEVDYKRLVEMNGVLDALYERLDAVVDQYKTLKQQLYDLNKRIQAFDGPIAESFDEKEMNDVQHSFGKYTHLVDQNQRLTKEIAKLQQELYNIDYTPPDIDYNTQLAIIKENIDDWQKFDEWCEATKLLSEKNVLQERVDQSTAELNVALQMKEKIALAETIALNTIVSTVNHSVQSYLDAFFPSEPLQALISVDSSKVNFDLIHKGHSIALQCLSGGERDRLSLAFQLTFAELEHCPVLLLDECVSSLDQETANIVFETLQERHSSRLVILIAHQIITGTFQHVLKV